MKFGNASDKESWEKLLIMDMMSSKKVYRMKAKKSVVEEMFKKLDGAAFSTKTPQARRQMKRQVLGEASNRPITEDAPKWAVHL